MSTDLVPVTVYPNSPNVYRLECGRAYKVGRCPDWADLIMSHGSVSRRHAVIEVAQQTIIVRDVGSRLGTFDMLDRRQERCLVDVGKGFRLGDLYILLGTAEPRLVPAVVRSPGQSTNHKLSNEETVSLSGIPLTRREHMVLEVLLTGVEQKCIADELEIEPSTAHNHVTHVYEAHGVHSHAELLALYLNKRATINKVLRLAHARLAAASAQTLAPGQAPSGVTAREGAA
jgi:DNA-binding CsgD family transcriptional regulator